VVSGIDGIDTVEVIAFDPVLKLAWLIAGVCAHFKHGDDDDLDRDWLLPSGDGNSCGQHQGECGECIAKVHA